MRAAASVGDSLGRIHKGAAADKSLPAHFDTGAAFHALRIEPYLLATAERRPEVGSELELLAARTAAAKLSLVHGDVSPKNIMLSRGGPVFLDAECAWWGDPAFDVAFCLNHLALKCVAVPHAQQALWRSFAALAGAYRPHIAWEAPAAFERRAATLLPALMLARIDGKSPVEYITDRAQQDGVRAAAIELLRRPPARLDDVRIRLMPRAPFARGAA
jgi:aminoglycoside phosphotransferase (APT) family kinase protein